jgi:dolichol-phosphate mannosyltransferase
VPLSPALFETLRVLEVHRERFWSHRPNTAGPRLRWRANAVRHGLHVLPGQRILEIGAGSGLWTAHLVRATRGETSVVAAVANASLLEQARERRLSSMDAVSLGDVDAIASERPFDHIVGCGILCHERYAEQLDWMYELLKPGGQLLFFEANYWNPQGFLKTVVPGLGRLVGQAPGQIALRRGAVIAAAERARFEETAVAPFETLHGHTPASLIPAVQAVSVVVDNAPVLRRICGTLSIWARRPGESDPADVPLDGHAALFDAVSVVIPCHNEEANLEALVAAIDRHYRRYVHEVIVVNDNSTDTTGTIADTMARRDPRVRVIHRRPPNGVGRALRDGLGASRGRWILTLDCDFVSIVPELRDLFDAAADGADVVIGSRFSRDSLLINYPFGKILANRMFHLLARLTLRLPLRDVSNNLKLMRAEVVTRSVHLHEPHFAANAETGLAPLLAGWRTREVPVSWIDRTPTMGRSSFKLLAVAPGYARVLWRAVRHRGSSSTPTP